MLKTEKAYMVQVDAMILSAKGKKLAQLQKIDLEHQLSGMTIYDSLMNDKCKKSLNLEKSLKKHS